MSSISVWLPVLMFFVSVFSERVAQEPTADFRQFAFDMPESDIPDELAQVTDRQIPGQGNRRTVTAQKLIEPSSGTPQVATPRAVCTFASIGLYWTPDGGAEDNACRVGYRAAGEPTWREALPLWFDKRIGEYRGSIVQLQSGTTYEVRLELADHSTSAELKAATWSETFPIARTVQVDDMTGTTLTVDQSGTAAGMCCTRTARTPPRPRSTRTTRPTTVSRSRRPMSSCAA